MLYNTVTNGVPDEDDIVNAIDDMENLYSSCQWSGKLSDTPATYTNNKFTPIPKIYNPIVKNFPTPDRESFIDCKV